MQTVQSQSGETDLLTAEHVERLLDVDKSTIYRMAADGRLPAIKVGRQWRFPAEPIRRLLGSARTRPVAGTPEPVEPHETTAAASAPAADLVVQTVVDLVAELFGVMMVVTDMGGRPISRVANPCQWFVDRRDDPQALAECMEDWRSLAEELEFEPRLRLGSHEFECARALIRSGSHLVGMVLAGGVAPEGSYSADLHHLDARERSALLAALPRVAAALSRVSPAPTDDSRSS